LTVRYLRIFREILKPGGDMAATLKTIQELTDFTKLAFSSENSTQVLLYLVHHGAATSWTLQCDLHIPESTVYRILKRLRSRGLVEPAIKVKVKDRKGGPAPVVWATELTQSREIAAAVQRHYRLLSPKYRVAEKIAQSILDEFREGQPREIKYPEIMVHVRRLRIPMLDPDIADLAAKYLHENGVKVWR